MKIEYYVLDPAKNITVLVTTRLEENQRRLASESIMKQEKAAEQLGFIRTEKDVCYLDMAGGEFCGNAVRCAAFISKLDNVLCCGQKIRCQGSLAYIPRKLKGIRHSIVELPFEEHLVNKAYYEQLIKEDCCGEDAVGIMLFDEKKMKMSPLVYVPGADTMFWENSCASGTGALANYLLAKYNEAFKLQISEPGGIISIEADPSWDYIKLDGEIMILAKKDIEI